MALPTCPVSRTHGQGKGRRADSLRRRERDSNPRYLAVHMISNHAPSATRSSLRGVRQIFGFQRREWESNPRYLSVHLISNQAPSATRSSLPMISLSYLYLLVSSIWIVPRWYQAMPPGPPERQHMPRFLSVGQDEVNLALAEIQRDWRPWKAKEGLNRFSPRSRSSSSSAAWRASCPNSSP